MMDYLVLTIVGQNVEAKATFSSREEAEAHQGQEVKALDDRLYNDLTDREQWQDAITVGADGFVIIIEQQ